VGAFIMSSVLVDTLIKQLNSSVEDEHRFAWALIIASKDKYTILKKLWNYFSGLDYSSKSVYWDLIRNCSRALKENT